MREKIVQTAEMSAVLPSVKTGRCPKQIPTLPVYLPSLIIRYVCEVQLKITDLCLKAQFHLATFGQFLHDP